MVPTVEWIQGAVRLLDQSRLPEHVEFLDCRDYRAVADAIRELKVRGAPAIGVTAALGVALGAQAISATEFPAFAQALLPICDHLAATRPTAVNLFWAIDRMKTKLASLSAQAVPAVKAALLAEAQAILEEDIALCKAMGRHGAELIANGQTVLTHCNAGALATAGYGTARTPPSTPTASGSRPDQVSPASPPLSFHRRRSSWSALSFTTLVRRPRLPRRPPPRRAAPKWSPPPRRPQRREHEGEPARRCRQLDDVARHRRTGGRTQSRQHDDFHIVFRQRFEKVLVVPGDPAADAVTVADQSQNARCHSAGWEA